MASLNFNKTILGGRLTSDVELKKTPTGVSVVSFSLAVARKANREKTDFINCVAWKNTAEFISKYFHKGSSICVEGEIQTRSWEDTNTKQKRQATEVIVSEVYFVDSKSDSEQSRTASTAYIPAEANFEEVSSDDELPF